MSLLLLSLLVIALLTAGYLLYGSFIARQYNLDDANATPATVRNDGVDFVPTRPFYLMGQHFSAIAAAGPIVGPVLACMAFGWLPCILWIVLGVILIGAVHDVSALVASVRHGAHSVAEIARQHLGRRAYLSFVAFIWLALLYVIVAFTEVTAETFVGVGEEVEGLGGGTWEFNRGGAVAFASVAYLGLALVMGVVQRYLRPPMWLATAVFVPATLAVIFLGTRLSTLLVYDVRFWQGAILAYCFVASLLPMWLLQQPRGYLGGFVLYLAIGAGVVGLLFGDFVVQQPPTRPLADYGAFFGLSDGPAPAMTALIFPFLFVTIACGACSGFHGLVCGGTTSRQIAKESHCKPIGFGAMLLEGFVAVIALATVMIVSPSDLVGESGAPKPPGAVYGEGLARFCAVVLGDDPGTMLVLRTFGTMAVATFIFDTLDVSTRLGRYLLQELTGKRGPLAGAAAAGLTAGVPLLVLLATQRGSYKLFWTLFGTSNQLLAALTLLGVTVWLYRSGKRYWYTLGPMAFVMAVTLTALALQIYTGLRAAATGAMWTDEGALNPMVLNAAVGAVLMVVAAVFVAEAWRSVRSFRLERIAERARVAV